MSRFHSLVQHFYGFERHCVELKFNIPCLPSLFLFYFEGSLLVFPVCLFACCLCSFPSLFLITFTSYTLFTCPPFLFKSVLNQTLLSFVHCLSFKMDATPSELVSSCLCILGILWSCLNPFGPSACLHTGEFVIFTFILFLDKHL